MGEITKIKVNGDPESSYQLYPRNEEFAKRAGGSGVQPDWNQNDDTQPDYVKNRPFYTGDPVEIVLLEETTATFAYNGSTYQARISVDFSLEIGTTYEVSWDGTVYSCVSYDFGGRATIGNQYIFTSTSDTGEPFIAAADPDKGTLMIATRDTSPSHTISISGNIVQVTKINEKYLPELQYMDKVNPTGTGAFSLNRKADTTVGVCSFTEGIETTASGYYSHAEGFGTTASGYASHAEGYDTTASGDYSHAEGKYNIEDTANKYAHIIGNGKSVSERHNCFMVGWDGAIYVQASDNTAIMMKLTIKSDGTISAEQVTV